MSKQNVRFKPVILKGSSLLPWPEEGRSPTCLACTNYVITSWMESNKHWSSYRIDSFIMETLSETDALDLLMDE